MCFHKLRSRASSAPKSPPEPSRLGPRERHRACNSRDGGREGVYRSSPSPPGLPAPSCASCHLTRDRITSVRYAHRLQRTTAGFACVAAERALSALIRHRAPHRSGASLRHEGALVRRLHVSLLLTHFNAAFTGAS